MTYSSLRSVLDHYRASPFQADVVFVTRIYPACETPLPGVSSQGIIEAIERRAACDVVATPAKSDVIAMLKERIRTGDFIISLGAGDIWTVTEELAHFLEEGSFCVV